MKPVDVNPSIYIDFNKENSMEGPQFKVIFKYFCERLCCKFV